MTTETIPTLCFGGKQMLPDRDSYRPGISFGAVVTDIGGGPPRSRMQSLNNAVTVSVTYTFDLCETQWFLDKWYTELQEGTLPIKLPLELTGSDLLNGTEYVATILGADIPSFAMVGVNKIGLSLSVVPIIDRCVSAARILCYEAFGGDLGWVINNIEGLTMALSSSQVTQSFTSGIDFSNSQYTFVMLDTTKLLTVISSDRGYPTIGVIQNNPVEGSSAAVTTAGVTVIMTAEDLSVGDKITSDENGVAKIANPADTVIGIVTIAANAGGLASMLLDKIAGQAYQLPVGLWDMTNKELVSFTRPTKAWLDGKEYAIDEPRYKDGELLVEGQATNYNKGNNPTDFFYWNGQANCTTDTDANGIKYTRLVGGNAYPRAADSNGQKMTVIVCWYKHEKVPDYFVWNNRSVNPTVETDDGKGNLISIYEDLPPNPNNPISGAPTDCAYYSMMYIPHSQYLLHKAVGLIPTNIPTSGAAATRAADIATVRDK